MKISKNLALSILTAGLPTYKLDISRIRVVYPVTLIDILPELLKQHMLGFDIEYDKTNHPELVQFATDQGEIYLFQRYRLTSFDCLKELFESSVFKVGVGSTGDARNLLKSDNLELKNVIDLGSLAASVNSPYASLRGLCAQHLSIKLPKSSSDNKVGHYWDTRLTHNQRKYAGLDALMSLKLYQPVMDYVISRLGILQ
jgi:ribonuclease D